MTPVVSTFATREAEARSKVRCFLESVRPDIIGEVEQRVELGLRYVPCSRCGVLGKVMSDVLDGALNATRESA